MNILDKKDFDTLDWSFLLRVLTAFGFSHVFINLVEELLRSPHLSFLSVSKF